MISFHRRRSALNIVRTSIAPSFGLSSGGKAKLLIGGGGQLPRMAILLSRTRAQ
jgi:hypothetical protein